ncbi:hypothetical protein Tco_0154210 [Tanacetum coccineum]
MPYSTYNTLGLGDLIPTKLIVELADRTVKRPKEIVENVLVDKLEFKGKSVVGAFMNAPIFVGTFSVVTDFAVIEDMDRYRDEEMGDVIVGKEF